MKTSGASIGGRTHSGSPARTSAQAGNAGAPSPTAMPRHENGWRISLEDARLFDRFQRTRDPGDREALVKRFIPMSVSLAARYRHTSEPFEDLVQVAAVGLLKAIDRFDLAYGTAFSSFAVPTILGELRRHIRDTTWSLRVPRELKELVNRLDRVLSLLESELGRPPTVAEVAEGMDSTEERVLEARRVAASRSAVSLDGSVAYEDDGSSTVSDLIGAPDAELQAAEDAATVEQLLDCLEDRERKILKMRFYDDLVQTEIGERVGVSQMHVSRLIRQSLTRIREDAAGWREESPPANVGRESRAIAHRTWTSSGG